MDFVEKQRKEEKMIGIDEKHKMSIVENFLEIVIIDEVYKKLESLEKVPEKVIVGIG